METVNKIKLLLKNAKEIKDLFFTKIPAWKDDPGHYDKKRWGFVKGDADGFYESQTITLHFGAWAGSYGSSSVYKQINLDGEIFREHFLRYLNSNKASIMMSIADTIESDAAKLKSEAEKELNSEISKLQQLETPKP